jgi:iron complex outermembrane receptor protein
MTWTFNYILKTTTSVVTAFALLPAVAQAEQDTVKAEQPVAAEGGTETGEIIVTAQHREQRLQDVGISISAIGGEQLVRLGVTSSIDIGRITPGVHVSGNFGGQTAQYTIRGVTQNDFSDVLEGPVAVYFDDGYIGSNSGQVFGTFDLERVEILKVPRAAWSISFRERQPTNCRSTRRLPMEGSIRRASKPASAVPWRKG